MAKACNDSQRHAHWPANLAELCRRVLGETEQPLMKSEHGAATKISLRHFDGGRDAKYLVAVLEPQRPAPAERLAVSEWLWPTEKLSSTEIVYDCTEEILHGKAKPILCDLSQRTVRVFAFVPTQVETIPLTVSKNIGRGGTLPITIRFGDASGKPLAGVLPFHLSLLRPDGQPLTEYFQATERHGVFATQLAIPAHVPPGEWKLQVRSQLNGLTKSLAINVAAARD